ncbi:DUF4355 domain-containing protein [Deinococcus aquatilis]|uniref:DUF4355 domain-containing protein n=1 Tax=Deinococcus aquatilis TaxID=519440 RepID=UPI00035DCC7C|nr:DUF4355 domain-containing protein [Deinococcus aquatilis]
MNDDTQTQTTETETPTTSTQTETQGTTFTQADVDRIVAERLARDRKQQQEASKAEAAKAALSAEERVKAEKEEAERERDEARKEAREARYRADLKGEVVDVNAALKLINDEKHVKDGAVDVKALLKDFPFLAPARTTTPGAGGVQGTDAPDTSTLAGAMAADGIKF